MKGKSKIIYFFVVLFAGQASALDFPVTDAKFKQCLNELAQKNNWENLDAVKSIECNSKGIQSLDGIQQFHQLESLSVYNNQLSEINLKHLTELQHLNVAKNGMKVIELSDLPKLKDLYVFGNKLAHLQLEHFPELQLIKANENQLLDFNYVDLPALEKIYSFNNKMVTFDIYHLPKLHYMDCRQNPMPNKLYDEMNAMKAITFLHDGNAKDWQ